MYLSGIYGAGKFVLGSYSTQYYLDHKLIEQRQINVKELLSRAADFLLQLEGVKDVYTSERLLQGAWTPGISKIRAAYNSRVSGDIMVEIAPGWRYVNTDTHEDQLMRASYLPFPIIFYGFELPEKRVDQLVSVDYIAPTLSKAMRIRAPNGCSKPPLF